MCVPNLLKQHRNRGIQSMFNFSKNTYHSRLWAFKKILKCVANKTLGMGKVSLQKIKWKIPLKSGGWVANGQASLPSGGEERKTYLI